MSNIVEFNANQLPAFARNRKEPSALSLALGAGNNTSKRISIKGGVFRLISGGKEVAAIEDRFLDVVFVAAAPKVSRIYYAGKWDPSVQTPPTCWASDGDTPDEKVKEKQSDSCAMCPQNVSGSGQGESKACRFEKRVAVVLANDVDGDVLQLTLPSKSIFGKEEGGNMPLNAYAKWLGAQGISPDEVVTRVRFDTSAESPKLFFKTIRWLTDDEYTTVKKQAETPEAKHAVTLTVAETDGVKSKANTFFNGGDEDEAPEVKPKAKPKAKAAPEPEPEVAEPKVRKETPPPSQVKTANVAALVSDWDTDD